MTCPEYVRDRDSVCPHIFSQNAGERNLFLVWCFDGACNRSISLYIIEGKYLSTSTFCGVWCDVWLVVVFLYFVFVTDVM